MATSNEDIMRELGRLGEAFRQLREDFNDEREAARENRSRIHARLDDQTNRINEMETTVILSGQTVTQQRDVISQLTTKVEENHQAVQPSLEDWKRIKTLGWGFSALLVAIGVTGASVLIYMGEAAVTIVRKWLRID
ncbi:DUF1515 domain-containing protein [Rhizobium sp. NTR19]|uniref:DUF1515 domain-containing protein n=1 Tax=Neorhizobium turbinariae TaxID=2937795 RepID=A0ABT0ITD6_9HYPH|nr:DUF1515 domain-containing protein [Neorhizobium turbinariae]MCK8781115.1 DUF1515 domain-containing protein [Neorhizobium turbinariae]